jgi:hypothetical protein
MDFHAKSGRSLSGLLSSVINESVRSAKRALREQDEEDPGKETQKPAPLPDEDKQALQTGDVDVDDVIEKMNTIRSGRSFKDESVKANMEQYVNKLSKAEKTALFAFLKAISQIVVAELPSTDAVDPSEKPSNIKMEKGNQVQKRTIKPNVIKMETPKVSKGPSAEDTSAPVPISPKKK